MSTHTSDIASVGFVYIPIDPSDPTIGETIRYDQFVQRLLKRQSKELMLAHCGLGVTGEAGELADAIKRDIIYGHTHTPEGKTIRAAIVEELGDLEFYMQATRQLYEIPQQEVLQHNALKLSDRYKGLAYTDLAAAVRADKQEKK